MTSRRRRRRRILLSVAVLALVAAATGGALLVAGASRRSDERAAYLAYERAILTPIKEGGRIVQQEMKPSLREIGDGDITGAQLLDRASAWRRAFTEVRTNVLAASPPRFLGDAEARWTEAMDAYLHTIAEFEALARGTEGERPSLIDRAAAAGEAADDTFDRAAEVMQRHRRRLGLGVSADFPDPAAG